MQLATFVYTFCLFLALVRVGSNAAKEKEQKKSKSTKDLKSTKKKSEPKANKKAKKGEGDNGDDGLGSGNPNSKSLSRATKIVAGTELFNDTIYSKPLVASIEVNSHALIEGARNRMRIQTDFFASQPNETMFRDDGYHIGPPELIQFEQVEDSDGGTSWELVHYHHPWSRRSDGGRADGLIRHTIMSKSDGLSNPSEVHSITGTFTNRFQSINGKPHNTISYALFVRQETGGSSIVIGKGDATYKTTGGNSASDYPITWTSRKMNEIDGLSVGGAENLKFVDKYTSHSQSSNMETGQLATYDARQAVEHILMYYKSNLVVLTLLDHGQTGSMAIALNEIPYPGNDNNARLVHIDWDPTQSDQEHFKRLKNIVMVRSEQTSDGTMKYKTSYMNQDGKSSGNGNKDFGENLQYTVVTFKDKWENAETIEIPDWAQGSDGSFNAELKNIRSVHGLYSVYIDSNYGYSYIKACYMESRIFLLAILNFEIKGNDYFTLNGMFPLNFPDGNGNGAVKTFGGGTSKLGGLRFLYSDADSNLFMMRQQGVQTSDETPYERPIYGLFDLNGDPITSFQSTFRHPLPSSTSLLSNLQSFSDWYQATILFLGTSYYNILLNSALAFGTDESHITQGVSLGSNYKAGYALKRFGLDSDHVVVREVGSNGDHAAIAMFKNPVDKSWRKRLIAKQVLPEDPGQNESGDHYQATLSFVNSAGQTVSPSSDENADLLIEVRADSPCRVTDDTNGYYYDIDRYSSFMARPDVSTGMLSLTVPADVLSQVIYFRIVNGALLQQSPDLAILNSVDTNYYPWTAANIASQAQQRMSNGAPSRRRRLSDSSSSLADERLYMAKENLTDSNNENTWKTKGGYDTTASNMEDLSTYCTTSAANILVTTDELSLGSGSSINPLTAATSLPEDSPSLSTRFSYAGGTIRTDPSLNSKRSLSDSQLPRRLGLFSSLSHALHDALHWLQHSEGEIYKSLGSDGVAIASAAEGLTVTVSKEIMKQMNGVEKELNQVVNTVEEYASVVLNVLVTIVEHTFMYEFIELLIALISLFIYFEDILALSKSFKHMFDNMVPVTVPDSFNGLATVASKHLGQNNDISDTLSSINSDDLLDEIEKGFLDDVIKNPLTKKILHKFTSVLEQALNDIDPDPELPFTFHLNDSAEPTIVEKLLDELASTATELSDISEEVIDLVLQVAEDATSPKAVYADLIDGLGSIAEGFALDELEEVFEILDEASAQNPADLAHDMLHQSNYITVKVPNLADLCVLFGIGTVSGSNLKLTGHEAVFFPIALISWVTVYQQTGKSISNVNSLGRRLETSTDLQLTSTGSEIWDLAAIFVDLVVDETTGIMWVAEQADVESSDALNAWLGWIEATSDLLNAVRSPTDNFWVYINASISFTLAISGVILSRSSDDDALEELGDALDFVSATVVLVNVGEVISYCILSDPDCSDLDVVLANAGFVISQTQGILELLYEELPDTEPYLEQYSTCVLAAPVLGYGLEAYAANDADSRRTI